MNKVMLGHVFWRKCVTYDRVVSLKVGRFISCTMSIFLKPTETFAVCMSLIELFGVKGLMFVF